MNPQDPETVMVMAKVERGENVRARGEDMRKGGQVFVQGTSLSVGALGLLAALGLRETAVVRAPRIGLLATGNELREPGRPLSTFSGGAIYECNRTLLAPLVAQAGAIPKPYPIIHDTEGAIQIALQKAFAQCDGVITTGGVSVGELDFVKEAFEKLGGRVSFWKVAMKPGKPLVFGRLGEKLFFGLPGNPVSALVTFLLLVRPALRRLLGATNVSLARQTGTLADALVNHAERRHFMRVRVDETGRLHSTGTQASHILSSLAASNGLVDVPAQTTLPAGTEVTVLRWD